MGKFGGATKVAEGAVKGASVATAGATNSIGALGLATKAGALLLNPWVLGIGAATIAGVGLYKHLKKDAVPTVDLFADKMKTSSSEMMNYNIASKNVVTANVKISKSTKKAVGGYMELDKKAMGTITNLYVNGTKITKQTAKSITDTYTQMGMQIKTGMDKHYKQQEQQMKNFFANSKNITKKEQQQAIEGLQQYNNKQKSEVDQCEQKIKSIMDKASQEKRALTKDEQQQINKIQEEMKTNAVKTLSDSEVESKVIMERLKNYSGRITTEQASEVIKNAEKQRKESVNKANQQYDGTVKNIIRLRDESKTISKDQADKMIKEAERQRKESVDKANQQKSQVVSKIESMNSETSKNVNTTTGEILSKWDKLKAWWDGWKPKKHSFEWSMNKGNASGLNERWTGDKFYEGGLTTLHERGYELYDLQRGTRIYNHEASEEIVMQTAENVANKVANSVLKNFEGLTSSNGQSQTIIVPVNLDSREIARITAKPMNEELSKLNRRGGLSYA